MLCTRMHKDALGLVWSFVVAGDLDNAAVGEGAPRQELQQVTLGSSHFTSGDRERRHPRQRSGPGAEILFELRNLVG